MVYIFCIIFPIYSLDFPLQIVYFIYIIGIAYIFHYIYH